MADETAVLDNPDVEDSESKQIQRAGVQLSEEDQRQDEQKEEEEEKKRARREAAAAPTPQQQENFANALAIIFGCSRQDLEETLDPFNASTYDVLGKFEAGHVEERKSGVLKRPENHIKARLAQGRHANDIQIDISKKKIDADLSGKTPQEMFAAALEMATFAKANPAMKKGVELVGSDEEKLYLYIAAKKVGLNVKKPPKKEARAAFNPHIDPEAVWSQYKTDIETPSTLEPAAPAADKTDTQEPEADTSKPESGSEADSAVDLSEDQKAFLRNFYGEEQGKQIIDSWDKQRQEDKKIGHAVYSDLQKLVESLPEDKQNRKALEDIHNRLTEACDIENPEKTIDLSDVKDALEKAGVTDPTDKQVEALANFLESQQIITAAPDAEEDNPSWIFLGNYINIKKQQTASEILSDTDVTPDHFNSAVEKVVEQCDPEDPAQKVTQSEIAESLKESGIEDPSDEQAEAVARTMQLFDLVTAADESGARFFSKDIRINRLAQNAGLEQMDLQLAPMKIVQKVNENGGQIDADQAGEVIKSIQNLFSEGVDAASEEDKIKGKAEAVLKVMEIQGRIESTGKSRQYKIVERAAPDSANNAKYDDKDSTRDNNSAATNTETADREPDTSSPAEGSRADQPGSEADSAGETQAQPAESQDTAASQEMAEPAPEETTAEDSQAETPPETQETGADASKPETGSEADSVVEVEAKPTESQNTAASQEMTAPAPEETATEDSQPETPPKTQEPEQDLAAIHELEPAQYEDIKQHVIAKQNARQKELGKYIKDAGYSSTAKKVYDALAAEGIIEERIGKAARVTVEAPAAEAVADEKPTASDEAGETAVQKPGFVAASPTDEMKGAAAVDEALHDKIVKIGIVEIGQQMLNEHNNEVARELGKYLPLKDDGYRYSSLEQWEAGCDDKLKTAFLNAVVAQAKTEGIDVDRNKVSQVFTDYAKARQAEKTKTAEASPEPPAAGGGNRKPEPPRA